MVDAFIRGSVWWIDLGYSADSVMNGTRPCVVVSNKLNNLHSTTVNVVPFTTRKDELPMHPRVIINKKECWAMPEQILTVAKKELKTYTGVLLDSEMRRIDDAIKLQLSLDIKEDDLDSTLTSLLGVLERLEARQSNMLETDIKQAVDTSNKLELAKSKATGIRKYSNMSPIEKFNARAEVKPAPKTNNRKRVWTDDVKCKLLDEYEKADTAEAKRELMSEYGFKTIAVLQQTIYRFRKEFNLN